MKLLDSNQIKQKTKRLAIEILEHNFDEPEIILVGINNNGTAFATRLKSEMETITDGKVLLTSVHLSPANPLERPITVGLDVATCNGKVVIVVDDVANTGRTLHFAMKPFLEVVPKKIEVAVLIDRKHKSFPVAADYVGLKLATTVQENIKVDFANGKEEAVYLN